jgi:hypothetical protein
MSNTTEFIDCDTPPKISVPVAATRARYFTKGGKFLKGKFVRNQRKQLLNIEYKIQNIYVASIMMILKSAARLFTRGQ